MALQLCRIFPLLGAFAFALLLPCILCAQANPVIQVDSNFISQLVLAERLKDPEHNLEINAVTAAPFEDLFALETSPHMAFGFDDSRWWLRFRFYNHQDRPRTLILRLNRKNFDEFKLWQKTEQKGIRSVGEVGHLFEDDRFVLINGYYFAVTLQPGMNEFWAKCRNEIGSMHLTLSLQTPENFAVFSRQSSVAYGVFLGIMMLSLFFSAVMLYYYRGSLYLLYTAYIVSILMREAYYNSSDFDLFPVFQRYCTTILIAATYSALFRRFLRIWEYFPRLDKLIQVYSWLAFICTFLVWGLAQTDQRMFIRIILQTANVFNLVFIAMAIGVTLIIFKRSAQARIMVLGSIPLALAFTVISLRNLSLMPNYPMIQFLVLIGFIIEVLVIAFTFTRWYRHVEIDRNFLKLRVSVEEQEKQIAVQAAEQRVKDRIARDLHDDVAASMSGIRILSQVAIRQAADKAQHITPLLHQISRSAQATLDGLSDIIWAINPHADYLNDVADRIRDYAVRTLEAHAIDYQLDISRNLPALDLDVEARRNIYLIFKESVNNVLKHSQCKKLEIKLLVADGFMSLILVDDGVGFDLQTVQRGHGLDNLEKRAKDIGGSVHIVSSPGMGTRIEFRLPLLESRVLPVGGK